MRLVLLVALMTGLAGGGWITVDLSNRSDAVYAFEAIAINAHGQAIGSGTRDWEYARAFMSSGGGVVDLGVLPGTVATRAYAINSRGEVVGVGSIAGGTGYAFLSRNGKLARLTTKPSAAVALNDAGQAVGWARTRTGASHAVLWQGARMRDLGTLGGTASAAVAINGSGQVVGWSETGDRTRHAFMWERGRMRDLGSPAGASEAVAVNARGDVLAVAHGQRVWVWRAGKRIVVGTFALSPYSRPGAPRAYPLTMNDAGVVAGTFLDSRGHARPLVWRSGRTTYLPLPAGATTGGAVGMNRHGDVVGWAALTGDPGAGTHAVVWSGRGVTDLTGSPRPDETHSIANAINDRQQIVGTVTARMESARAMLWTPK